jgi:hypothetical protein
VVFPGSEIDLIAPFHEVGHHVENIGTDKKKLKEMEDMWAIAKFGANNPKITAERMKEKFGGAMYKIEYAASVYGLSIIRILEQSGMSLGISAKDKRDTLRWALSTYEAFK